MKNQIRKEQEIFLELEQLCSSKGYVHAIAFFCFRDNMISCSDSIVTPKDLENQYSMERLVRTEISTLIGLACKKKLDIELPSFDEFQIYVKKTELLLNEIHHSMFPIDEIFDLKKIGNKDFNPFEKGSVLREAIFYGGEAAYYFQYKDLSAIKYQKDNDWFLTNKGFSIYQIIDVVKSILTLQIDKINDVSNSVRSNYPNKWSFFDAYKFTDEEVAKQANIDIGIAKKVIECFSTSCNISGFESLGDFNPTNAYPIIKLTDKEYLLFQNYSLVEALYETPFFWFNDDKTYRSIAFEHRGEFTEKFSAERLRLVFGENRVFENIDIYDSKNNVGEIDVLVIFANRAIVLQAKSKKLTIAARKGNDNSLQDDFKKAVQDAYNQAYSCALLLMDKKYKLIDNRGNELNINREFKEIYPFCVVSDHYPALSFQARQFLEFQETEIIKAPFVMDVFFLDVITEMLQSPLYFLSYINRRTSYNDKIFSHHELTILSYHLKMNLWIDDEYNTILLEEDISAPLDIAMLARRDGLEGLDTPEGVLTKYKGTFFDQIIREIEKRENPAIIDLGFMLLTLNGDTIETINDGISHLIESGKKDGLHHDLTLGIKGKSGLTIHCNNDCESIASPRLERHCELRKYSEKANSWFGICIGITNTLLRFGVNIEYKWVQSDEMDELVKDLPKPQSLKKRKTVNFTTITRKSKKVGRNEKCPCGSGKKYKSCCLLN